MSQKEFLDAKEIALKSLTKAYSEEKVDAGISQVLTLINGIEGFYTSSSCAGRIVLLEIPSVGDKRAASFLGVWHRTILLSEFCSSSSLARDGLLWLLAQSPILHIGAENLHLADTMVKLAVSCGFKNSALKSTEKKIILEICSTERLDAPIGRDGVLFCDEQYLDLLIEISNKIIQRSHEKLDRLAKKIGKFTDFL
jgi:tRNA wybutosine-synthesizing protein 3